MADAPLTSDQTITLQQHRRILYEIKCKVAGASLDLGAYQDIERTEEELDALVEWLDSMGAA